jgi:hypothetical protein
MTYRPTFGDRVRVWPEPDCGALRSFGYAERRPCWNCGTDHWGNIWYAGHDLVSERGQVGEVIQHISELIGGHPWVVRFDRNITVYGYEHQPGGIVVNGGAYAPAELEKL